MDSFDTTDISYFLRNYVRENINFVSLSYILLKLKYNRTHPMEELDILLNCTPNIVPVGYNYNIHKIISKYFPSLKVDLNDLIDELFEEHSKGWNIEIRKDINALGYRMINISFKDLRYIEGNIFDKII